LLEFVARNGRVLRMRAGDQFTVGQEEKLRASLHGMLMD
jgi:hypothetical protein